MGGGLAGSAAAMAARQRGFEVTVADCAIPPIDKACGEGIMPDGVAAAGALGLDLTAAGELVVDAASGDSGSSARDYGSPSVQIGFPAQVIGSSRCPHSPDRDSVA